MWVEQFPNAKVLTNREAVTTMVNNVKKAGFTSIGLDVKGPEGYVSYRKNDLSKTPYLTATKNPNKQVKDDGFDLLEVVLQEAHKIGLKVYTSFNFFTEGNITVNDYAILHEHKDWEEIVQRPEDKGKLLKITESTRGKEAAKGKLLALAFVNPSNKEVQDFQLLRVEEVLKNYDIDGIVLDRCRYDNLYADFSHVTRNAFEEYLEKEGIEHATINLGGNVLTIGTKPDGSDYKIGIQKPFAADGEVLEVLSVHDRSVVSSGDYERYFEKDGVIYHHILDPQSGWPVQNDLDQVTILSDSSADGDALSTTCYVLGLEKGMKLIQEMDDVEAIFVTKDGEIHRSY